MHIEKMRKMFFDAFVNAGAKGLTVSELFEELNKERTYSVLFTYDMVDNWIHAQIELGRFDGPCNKQGARYFMAEKGYEYLTRNKNP